MGAVVIAPTVHVELLLWCHEDASGDAILDIETVEAEVVFLIRSAGQWPLHQTEIHFHPSSQVHRDVAAAVMSRYCVRA